MAVVGHPPPTIYDPISTASSMGSDDGIDSFLSDVGDFGARQIVIFMERHTIG